MNWRPVDVAIQDHEGVTHVHWMEAWGNLRRVNDNIACEHEPMFRENLLHYIRDVGLPWPMPTCMRCAVILLTR